MSQDPFTAFSNRLSDVINQVEAAQVAMNTSELLDAVCDRLQEIVIDLNQHTEHAVGETMVQVRLTYPTAIIVPTSIERWRLMSYAEKIAMMNSSGNDPETLFSAGHVDTNAVVIEFLDAETVEQ